jgi:hypothetical protein
MEKHRKRTNIYDRAMPHGRINLRISGFSSQSVVALDSIKSAIDALPRYHLSGIDEIRYQTDHLYITNDGEYFYTPRFSKAVFVQNDKIILMHDFKSLEEFHHVIYHEIGHHVFYRIINGAIRKQWVTDIYRSSRPVTQYGHKNASEDFAECYAYFLTKPKQLNVIDSKYRFMRDKIFGGVSMELMRGHIDLKI